MAKPHKPSGTDLLNDFMRHLDHPLKSELEVLRSIILGADPRVHERVKWNGPSFYSKNVDMSAFNVRSTTFLLLVVVFHNGKMIDDRLGFLEGDYKDRRTAKFTTMADIEAKRPALERMVRTWLDLHEATPAA